LHDEPGRRLRIAQVAPPFLPVPPPRYGGTERIVGVLADGLHDRGHDVTVFAAGDSTVSGRLVALVPKSLWMAGKHPDVDAAMARIVDQVEAYDGGFDVIHSHLEWYGFDWAHRSRTPVVSTLHGRIDIGPTAKLIGRYPDIGLVAISERQRAFWPDQNWLATIYHGLPFDDVHLGRGSGGYLLFVGRLTPEKGVDTAVEVARAVGMPLYVAAKAIAEHELQTYRRDVKPAEDEGIVKFMGEVGPPARDRLFGEAAATLMLGDWPEPFGLVAVESMATGTPVISLRAGALPEIIRDGIDGFLVDSAEEAAAAVSKIKTLDRERIRVEALRRFAAARMVDDYERLFMDVVAATPRNTVPVKAHPEGQTPLGVT
jgi:glycosyltransferase involved in cell wall biosynthesis